MKCSVCGYPIPAGATQCPNCQTPVSGASTGAGKRLYGLDPENSASLVESTNSAVQKQNQPHTGQQVQPVHTNQNTYGKYPSGTKTASYAKDKPALNKINKILFIVGAALCLVLASGWFTPSITISYPEPITNQELGAIMDDPDVQKYDLPYVTYTTTGLNTSLQKTIAHAADAPKIRKANGETVSSAEIREAREISSSAYSTMTMTIVICVVGAALFIAPLFLSQKWRKYLALGSLYAAFRGTGMVATMSAFGLQALSEMEAGWAFHLGVGAYLTIASIIGIVACAVIPQFIKD